jgi:GMP synthase (glutamine-hydrolysing)
MHHKKTRRRRHQKTPNYGGDWICLVDFGGQYTHLIKRIVKEITKTRIVTITPKRFRTMAMDSSIRGIILSGGPGHVKKWAPKILKQFKCPILGICYGYQAMGKAMGAKVVTRQNKHAEYGLVKVKMVVDHDDSDLFHGIPSSNTDVWMSHMDSVDWTVLTKNSAVQVLAHTATEQPAMPCAVCVPRRRWYGVQFHPEVNHTIHGRQIIANFIGRICGCPDVAEDVQDATIDQEIMDEIRKTVGPDDHVLLAVSGGVDSTVVAALLAKSLGTQRIRCVFVDTGLLREGEVDKVTHLFEQELEIPLTILQRKQAFLNALENVQDPETKRQRIGKLFGDVFQEYAKLASVQWLAQGTIYPDRIESGKAGHGSQCIKSHHNLALPDSFGLKVLEPIRDLYKDQVRGLAARLGLPGHVIFQQPFPGPGLAIRILGKVTEERLEMVRQADSILNRMLAEKHPQWYQEKVWQCFVALWATSKTVGVKGDQRSYEYPMAIRLVQSRDAMTARVIYPPTMSTLVQIANTIVNQVAGCNRVVFDLTGKPPGTIEYE